MSNLSPKPRQAVLGMFSLVMITVIAVDSIRNLPFNAEFGLSIVFFYVIGALFFMIPSALAAAELATGWPKTGGLYVWIREAYGKRWGLFVMWLQWIYNIVWYPTILSFLAVTLSYLFNPSLAENKYYILFSVLALFWLATFINCFGMRASSWLSSVSAIIGTLLPMIFIISLGIIWLLNGKPSQIDFNWQNVLPDLSNPSQFAFLTAVLFGMIGMEISAAHAEEVKDPQKNYPRALAYAAIIILVTMVLASLAIAVVVPRSELNLVSGLIDAFTIFFNAFHISWMGPIMAILIVLGGLGTVGAWVIGPSKGLLAAAEDGCLPTWLAKTNRAGAPIAILLTQAILCSVLSLCFIFMPTVHSSYWLLSDLTAQLALLIYILLFSAVVVLRYKAPHVKRAFQIPGGKLGVWLLAILSISLCLIVIGLGFIPPDTIDVGSTLIFESLLIGSMLVFCIIPFIIYHLQQKSKGSSSC